MRETRRGMQSADQPEAQATVPLAQTQQRLAWLYERQRVIEAELLNDLPRKKRRNWQAARDLVNAAIQRHEEG